MRRHGVNPFPELAQFKNAGYTDGARIIELTAPLRAITSDGEHEVPAGFRSDCASIPRIAWPIVGHPLSEFLEDAVWHDFGYRKESDHLGYTRKQMDKFLRETMWNRGFPAWKIAAFYSAVRLGGWRNWKKR